MKRRNTLLTLLNIRRVKLIETLTIIGKSLNDREITWGIGGSLLLSFHQLITNPNDIDILVDENHANQLNEIIAPMGESKKVLHSDPFRTNYFTKHRMNNTDIDIMGGFAIQHSEGIYKLSLNKESIVAHITINGVEIPLCSLEDWYILYWLIPGKQEKSVLIENYLRTNGVKHSWLLEEALKQQLPYEVKERVKKLLN
jgi:hypothetical protein